MAFERYTRALSSFVNCFEGIFSVFCLPIAIVYVLVVRHPIEKHFPAKTQNLTGKQLRN